MKGKVNMPTALLPTMAILRCLGWGGAILDEELGGMGVWGYGGSG